MNTLEQLEQLVRVATFLGHDIPVDSAYPDILKLVMDKIDQQKSELILLDKDEAIAAVGAWKAGSESEDCESLVIGALIEQHDFAGGVRG